jgi:hypothetical protein
VRKKKKMVKKKNELEAIIAGPDPAVNLSKCCSIS